MSRNFVLLPILVCLLFSNSDANGQPPVPPPGCPNELIWTDGIVYVYDKVLCATTIGGNCSWSTIPGIVFYDQIVTTGCKPGPSVCVCATDVDPIGHGGGGAMSMDVNGRPASKYNKDRIPNFEEYVGKDNDSATWFKFYKLKLGSKPGTLPISNTTYRVCVLLSNPPVKCDGKTPACVPADQFKPDLSIEITQVVSGQPTEVTVTDTSSGGTSEVYKVVFQ